MNPYVSLAKEAVENFVRDKKIIEPPADLPEEFLNKKSGVFVTIEKELRGLPRGERQRTLRGLPRGERQRTLRGCIGTYLPTAENIAEEIIQNAIAAATEDYRFGPVREEELNELSYAVYILNKPELVKNIKKLDPKKYGIIVKTAAIAYLQKTDVMFDGLTPPKSGLLLPDLEGINTVEQQISLACQKGRINPEKEKIIIYKFTVEKYE